MVAYIFDTILKRAARDTMALTKRQSRAWFRSTASTMTSANPTRMIRSNSQRLTDKPMIGRMYLFNYDPKHKGKLPYYDRFPLVFPFRKTQDGFIGLNMHYLPYHLRIALLDKLMVFRSNNRMDETTRLKYSWATIDGISKFNAAIPCVKQYLTGHVKTQFRKVSSEDWVTAMMLPVERFVGASKQEVWTESQRKIRRA